MWVAVAKLLLPVEKIRMCGPKKAISVHNYAFLATFGYIQALRKHFWLVGCFLLRGLPLQ